MAEPYDIFSKPQQMLHVILTKITAYQHSFSDGRAVELEELKRKRVLSPEDIEFMSSHSVTYKPHRVSDYHAVDMLHMPTDGGCVFVGPGGPPLRKRRGRMAEFESLVVRFLKILRPADELLLHIEFSQDDGMGIAPEMICFNFKSATWLERLQFIRSVAAGFDLHPLQDEEIQAGHTLTYCIPPDPARTAEVAVALLSQGCGLAEEAEIIYSAGALDESS